MIEQVFEHVDGHAGVGVSLSVAVPQHIWGDQGAIERQRCPVGAQQFAVNLGNRARPSPKRHPDAGGGQVTASLPGAQQRGRE